MESRIVCFRIVVVLLAGIRIYVENTRAFWERVNVELQGMWTEREDYMWICVFAFRDDYAVGK